MKTHFSLAFISTCIVMMTSIITTSATAAIQINSTASWERSQSYSRVVLRAITASNSPTDYYVFADLYARGEPWVGPGYNIDGIWARTPLVPHYFAAAVGEKTVNDPAPGSHCANGRHKWTSRSNVVVSDIYSVQRCVTVTEGGGGGGCSVVNPVTTLLTLDGTSTAISGAERSPLTTLGAGENGRTVVLDEFAMIDMHSGQIQSHAVSAAFELPAMPSALEVIASSGVEVQAALAHRRVAAPTTSQPIRETKDRETSSAIAMLIQHQREHLPNANFTPIPKVTFAMQAFAEPGSQGRRGFAVVDIGESGQIRDVQLWSSDGQPLAGILTTAISHGLHSSFQDQRRHDHRVYLAFHVHEQMLRLVGDPIVTLPQCCESPCKYC